jgi:hypothetical protein
MGWRDCCQKARESQFVFFFFSSAFFHTRGAHTQTMASLQDRLNLSAQNEHLQVSDG